MGTAHGNTTLRLVREYTGAAHSDAKDAPDPVSETLAFLEGKAMAAEAEAVRIRTIMAGLRRELKIPEATKT